MRVGDGKRYRLNTGYSPFTLVGYYKGNYEVCYTKSGFKNRYPGNRIVPFDKQTTGEILMEQYEGKLFKVVGSDWIVRVVDVTESGKLVVDRNLDVGGYDLIPISGLGEEVEMWNTITLFRVNSVKANVVLQTKDDTAKVGDHILLVNSGTVFRVLDTKKSVRDKDMYPIPGPYQILREV